MRAAIAASGFQRDGPRRAALPSALTVGRLALVGVLAGAFVLITIARVKGTGGFLFDFKGDLYRPGQAILHGRDPYHPGYLAMLAATVHAGGTVSPTFALAVYPAPSLVASVPFALLPYVPSGLLFLGMMIAAMIGGLRCLGVRDWRCIAVALVSWPFVFGLDVGALGPVLVLGIGVAWRLRARLSAPAIAIASVVVAKLFPWTLLVWLLVTRRFRTLVLCLVIAVLMLVGAWAVIGFAGFADYPQMLANLSVVERGAGVSLVSGLLGTGVSAGPAEVGALTVGALLLVLAHRFARRRDGDAQALGLAVIAALVASPIVWPHYYVLLFVPIALTSPRLTMFWFLPLLTVLAATPNAHTPVQVLVWLALAAVVAVRLCRSTTIGEAPVLRATPVGVAP